MSVGTGNLSSNRATDSTHARITATGNTWGGASGIVSLYSQYGSVAVTDVQQLDDISTDSSGSWSTQTGYVSADKTILYRAKVTGGGIGGNGNTKSKKSGAVLATASAPSVSNITGSAADLSCNYYPNVLESTATVTFQYKKNSDAWPGTETTADTQTNTYAQQTMTRSLSGLDPLTDYNVRLKISRDSTTDTVVYSSVTNFSTITSSPILTTSAATGVTYKAATLNGTINAYGFSTVVTFIWGTSSGVYPNETGQVTGSPFSDSTVHNISAGIVGLDPSTTYYYKAKGVYNGTAYYGSENSFASSAAPAFPEITTNAADQLAPTSARLNGTVRPYGNSSKYYFDWGTTTGYGSSTTKQGPSSSMSNVAFNDTITGLVDGTTYHFRAVAERQSDLGLYYGADAEFTHTSQDLVASQEDHMLTFEYDRAYGVQSTVYFAVATPSGTGSNTFISGITFAANDVKVSKDGGQFVDATNLATIAAVSQDVGNSPMYALVLTASELSAEDVVVSIHDATGADFRDALIHVRTKIQTGQLTVNADNIATNTDAIVITPNGTGKGIDVTAGDIYVAGKVQTVGNLAIGGALAVTGNITAATMALSTDLTVGNDVTITGDLTAATIGGVLSSMVLDYGTCGTYNAGGPTLILGSSASTAADEYNGAILVLYSGQGAGQMRTITDYAATSKTATLDSAFVTSPNTSTLYYLLPGQPQFTLKPLTELSGLPDIATATYGDLLKFLFQRFAYKRYQDATSQKLYKADSSTVLATGTFQDNTTDQTVGKLV